MKELTGLWLVLLSLLGSGGTFGTETETEPGGTEPEPSGGYCLGTGCFTVFREPADFPEAQTRCAARGGGLPGHLMTVRSSVSQDLLLILLGNQNRTGRFWIGLHLPAGCPDPAAELRGFRWVTGDPDSDFSNWPPHPDSSCAAPRCVTVSAEEDFRWAQQPCGGPADGFLCEYSFSRPCPALAAGGGAVTYRTPVGVVSDDAPSLPPGSTAVRTPPRTKFVCLAAQWLQAPWSCEVEEGGCEHRCAVDAQRAPACSCPPGQAVNPQNRRTCEAAPEDPCVALRCAHTCILSAGSYACVCEQGFRLDRDGRSCVDFNDCRDARQCPGDNFRCVNTVGGFQCVCADGYRSVGGQCVDVDECASAPCEHLCANTPGGFTCSCYDGYRRDPQNPQRCQLHCGREECPAECDPNDRYQCFCPDGYISEERGGPGGGSTVCIDIDECSFLYCDQDCENTWGGYVCSCAPGYNLVDQYRCVRNQDDTDPDVGGGEGSGAPSFPTTSEPEPESHPDPSGPPSSGGAVGGAVGVLVVSVVLVLVELQ